MIPRVTLAVPAVALGAVLAVAACASPAAEPSPERASIAATVERGVSVNLVLDRAVVGANGSIEAVVTAQNVGRAAVRWRGGGCRLLGSITVLPLEPAEQRPADGDRLIEAFIASIGAPADRLAPTTTIDTTSPSEGRVCQIDHGFSELAPGDHLSERVTWRPTNVAGGPIPPGAYEVVGAFPMLSDGSGLIPAEFDAGRDIEPVSVRIAIDIGGQDRWISGAEAIRALIDATDLGDWLRAGSIDARVATLTTDDGAWRLEIRLPNGRRAVGRVGFDGGQPTMTLDR